jgi:hypothetical protein
LVEMDLKEAIIEWEVVVQWVEASEALEDK